MKVVSNKWPGVSNSFIRFVLCALLFGFTGPAESQIARVPRIGYVTDGAGAAYLDVFRTGLLDLGYIDGKE